MNKYISAFVFMVCFFSFSSAQEQFRFTTLTTRDGLPNASVSAIVQDGRGFIWLGTQNGLARYDGYNFKIYENDPFFDNVLSHNQVQTLYLDEDTLWIGTYGGLNKLDLKSDTITVYQHHPENPESLNDNLVVSISRDAAGNLWIGTAVGLDRLDERTGKFIHYIRDNGAETGIPTVLIRDIHLDTRGSLWVATSGKGLWKYQDKTDSFLEIPVDTKNPKALPSQFVMSISEDKDGQLWFGTWFGGLSRLVDRVANTFETVALADDRVYFINAEEQNRVLVGTWGGGLFVYNKADKTVQRFLDSDGIGAIPNNVVYSAMLDTNGIFWIGTNGGGVCHSERRDINYKVYQGEVQKKGVLPIGRVTAVIEDKLGVLWVAVYSNGLNRLDRKTGIFTQYLPDKKNPRSLPDTIINSMYIDSLGQLWLCTNGGLARYDSRTDDFTVFRNNPLDPKSINDSVVYCILETADHEYWIGLYQQGLDKFNPKTGTFTHFPPDPGNDKFPSDGLVFSLAYDANGELWLGMNNGLNHLTHDRFIRYNYDAKNRNGISSDTLRILFRDSKNRLWLGSSSGGLMRYDPLKDSFIHFTKTDGLPHNSIRSILEAKDGAIWVGTASGLAIIDKDGYSFRGYSMFNDLRDKELHTGAWITASGIIYLGGQNVLYEIDSTQAFPETSPPNALISEIKVNGQSIVSYNNIAAAYVDELKLASGKNNLSIAFASSDLREPGRNLYSYILEGFDKRWSAPSHSTNAVYTNLPGGSYVFRLRVSDNNGFWNNEAYVLPIKISYPFWFSLPGILVIVVFLTGTGYSVAVIISRAVLRRKVEELTLLKTSLEKANKKLEELSILDSLTGISNRRFIDHTLPMLTGDASRERKPLSLLMADIDFFKNYNDKYGHRAGDEILKKVAMILEHSLERSHDIAARYGGEEFLIILPNTNTDGAKQVAERILENIASATLKCDTSEIAHYVTISIGVHTAIPFSEKQVWELVEKADKALYKAKASGRNRFEIES